MSIYSSLNRSGAFRPLLAKHGKTNFRLFFDRAVVRSSLDRKEQAVLSRTGAFVRALIRRKIRKGRKRKPQGSAPGEPPRYFSRGFVSLKDGIFFTADLDTSSVRIGPNSLRTKTIPLSHTWTSELLEFGGVGKTFVWRETDPPRGEYLVGRWRARPYVKPAEKPGRDKFKELTQSIPFR